ncbi:hypothetical protein HS7_03290 [Sulfolobales archaeon HS-7]|nr:hypothetical protein HS7_03290 [Sulfolobales archaeon HS-7]
MKVGKLELGILGEIELEGKKYKVARVPSYGELKEEPPSWNFVKENILTWRPFVRVKMVKVGDEFLTVLNDVVLDLDEEMFYLVNSAYQMFVVSKNPELRASNLLEALNEFAEKQIRRSLTPEEKVYLNLRGSFEIAVLRDLGALL